MIYYSWNDDNRANTPSQCDEPDSRHCCRDCGEWFSHAAGCPADVEESEEAPQMSPQPAQDEMPDLLPF